MSKWIVVKDKFGYIEVLKHTDVLVGPQRLTCPDCGKEINLTAQSKIGPMAELYGVLEFTHFVQVTMSIQGSYPWLVLTFKCVDAPADEGELRAELVRQGYLKEAA